MIIYITYNKNSQSFTRCQSDDDDPSIAEILTHSIEDDENFLKFKISLNTSSLEEQYLAGTEIEGEI
jgi:hypothetical protein